MKRVMIVDDEFIMRIGIKSMIAWEENGFQLVGEAVSGQDAIDKLPLLKPDIILTDLVMEPVNGLELIEYCQKHWPHIRIVVLSNYDDFENVKTAMKLGAKDYLLKLTTQPEQLLCILNEIAVEIDAQPVPDSSAQELINRSAGVIRQRILRMMLDPACAMREDDIYRDLKMIGVTCDPRRPYALLQLTVANFFLLEKNGEDLADSMFYVTLENAIDEIVREHFEAQVFHREKGVFLVMINVESPFDPESFHKKLSLCFDRINTCVERYFGVSILGCVSQPVQGTGAFAGTADRCAETVGRMFTMRENRLVDAVEKAPPLRSAAEFMEDISLSQWAQLLELCDFNGAQAFLDRLLNRFWDQPVIPRTIREKLYELYHMWKTDAAAKRVSLEEITSNYGLSLYHAIFYYDLLSTIRSVFRDILDAYEGKSLSAGCHSLNRDISRVIAYVNANLKSDVSAAAAARSIHMSESYFSRFFRKETGWRFVDYVNRLRIEKSKDLLLRTDRKIGDIAAEVGIENPNYFSILFKKQTGMSPMEYRATRGR